MEINKVLKNFLNENEGKIVCITNDFSLVRVLRYSIASFVKTPNEYLYVFESPEMANQTMAKFFKSRVPFVIILEREIEGVKNAEFIRHFNRLYPLASVIVVGTDMTINISKYFYEIGAKAILSKPLSANVVQNKLSSCMVTSKEENLIAYVRQLIAEANNEDAMEAVQKFLEQNSNNSLALCLKGDVLLADGRQEEAIKAYERSAEFNMHYIEPLKRLAALYKYVDDNKAISALQKIEAISPFNPDRKLEMAEIHMRLGDLDRAKELLHKGFRQASGELHFSLGDMAEKISGIVSDKDPEFAKKYLIEAINKKTKLTILDIHMFNELGILHRNKREWEKAVEVYKKALTFASKDPAIHYNMALAYYDGEKRSEVRKCLEKAFLHDEEFYKGNTGVSYNIGSIYLEYGDKDAAKPFFEHVLELDPDNVKAKKKLKKVEG